MSKNKNRVGIHGSDAETGRAKEVAKEAGEKVAQISHEEFAAKAKPLVVSIGGKEQLAMNRRFASGSIGWYAGDKVIVEIDGKPVRCTVSMSIVVIGSKSAGE